MRTNRQRVISGLAAILSCATVSTMVAGGTASAALSQAKRSGRSHGAVAHAPKPGSLGTLVDATSAPAAVLDPMYSNSAVTREIDAAVFDELVTYNQHYEITPDLAKSWKSTAGGRNWRFDLVRGVKFQNGETVTSRDVVASLKRFMAVGVNGAAMKQIVASVSAPGADVVDVKLKKPDADFLAMLANPLTFVAIMPAKYAATRSALKPPHLIGTGPYEIAQWHPDQYTLLKRFSGYTPVSNKVVGGYGGKKVAYYRAIKYKVVPNPQTRLLGLDSGQFQYAESLPFTAYRTLRAHGLTAEIDHSYVQPVWYFNNYQYPTNNVWFRRAMAQALNDTSILQVITSDQSQFYKPNGSLFYPAQSEFYDPHAGRGIYNSPNMKKVKADLGKAHYKGQPVVVLTNQQYTYMYQSSVSAAAQWKAAGINVKLKVLTWPGELTYLTKKSGFGLFASGNTLRFDPADEASNIGAGGADDWGFSNPTINKLLAAYNQAMTTAAQKSIVRRLQQAYWRSVPELQVGDEASLDGASTRLHNYQVWYLPRFWNVW